MEKSHWTIRFVTYCSRYYFSNWQILFDTKVCDGLWKVMWYHAINKYLWTSVANFKDHWVPIDKDLIFIPDNFISQIFYWCCTHLVSDWWSYSPMYRFVRNLTVKADEKTFRLFCDGTLGLWIYWTLIIDLMKTSMQASMTLFSRVFRKKLFSSWQALFRHFLVLEGDIVEGISKNCFWAITFYWSVLRT